jgi:hypothetical protein
VISRARTQNFLNFSHQSVIIQKTLFYGFFMARFAPFYFLFFSLELLHNGGLQLIYLWLQLVASVLQLSDLNQHFRFPLLCLQGFSHSKCNWTFVESLISLDGHFDLVSDSDEEEPPFRAVDSDLSNELIEGLWIELLSDGADTGFTCLSFL